MNEVETLKKKIEALESQIEEERLKHKKTIERVKSENYEALEASQTRYQAELEKRNNAANDNKDPLRNTFPW